MMIVVCANRKTGEMCGKYRKTSLPNMITSKSKKKKKEDIQALTRPASPSSHLRE